MKVGQKDPCPCGSGKKYKHCHAKKDVGKRQTGMWMVPAGVFVVGIGLIYFVSHGKGASPVSTSAPMPLPATTTAQPVTNPTTTTSSTVTAQSTAASKDQTPLPGGATPQPWQYDTPRNRYWHPTHAHWHDGTPPPPAERAAEMSQAGSRAADQSPLPGGVMPAANYYDAAKDRYWSAEHAHWHTGHPPAAVSSPTVTTSPAPATKTP